MKTRLSQSTHLSQEMRANPRLYQAMDLLQLPLMQLQQRLRTEMQENPFLEMDDRDPIADESLDAREEAADERADDEIDWEEILLDGFSSDGRSGSLGGEREYREPVIVEQSDLTDHLHEQIRMLTLTSRERLLAAEILGNLDDAGFLTCSLDELRQAANAWHEEHHAEADAPKPFSGKEVERALATVQSLDPAGVAARDTRECLLLQLARAGEEDSLASRMLRDHYDLLLKHHWKRIARATGAPLADVQAAADRISTLNPKPGHQYNDTAARAVLPDLLVREVEGEYLIFLNDAGTPRLQLSRAYRDIARDKKQFTGENRKFIAEKLNSANWLIQTIEQRRQTMLAVMEAILDVQRGFFERGVQALRPLTLKEIADVVGVHESTVSRVTSEKYVQTPRGVYSLKFFFSPALSRTDGSDVSARGTKDRIREIIEGEDPSSPLTDQQVAEQLEEEGIQIARRTVAKYRGQMNLLSARMRKRTAA